MYRCRLKFAFPTQETQTSEPQSRRGTVFLPLSVQLRSSFNLRGDLVDSICFEPLLLAESQFRQLFNQLS